MKARPGMKTLTGSMSALTRCWSTSTCTPRASARSRARSTVRALAGRTARNSSPALRNSTTLSKFSSTADSTVPSSICRVKSE